MYTSTSKHYKHGLANMGVVGHGGGPGGLTGPQEQVVVDTLPELLLLSLDSTSITSSSFYIPVTTRTCSCLQRPEWQKPRRAFTEKFGKAANFCQPGKDFSSICKDANVAVLTFSDQKKSTKSTYFAVFPHEPDKSIPGKVFTSNQISEMYSNLMLKVSTDTDDRQCHLRCPCYLLSFSSVSYQWSL